jgi:hypothetical protein
MDIKILRELHTEANRIFNSQANWDTKYDLIFSRDISQAVFRQIRLEYCDPDTTYQEDVTAFITAFNEKMTQLEKAFES